MRNPLLKYKRPRDATVGYSEHFCHITDYTDLRWQETILKTLLVRKETNM